MPGDKTIGKHDQVTFKGVTMELWEHAVCQRLPFHVVRNRLARGKSVDEALSAPLMSLSQRGRMGRRAAPEFRIKHKSSPSQ